VLVDRAPQVVDRAVDPDEDFIEMPFVAGPCANPSAHVGDGARHGGAEAASPSAKTRRDTVPRSSGRDRLHRRGGHTCRLHHADRHHRLNAARIG
jgi:hypothetical protein